MAFRSNKRPSTSVTPIDCNEVEFDFGKIEHKVGKQTLTANLAGCVILPPQEKRNPHIEKVHQQNLDWLVLMGFVERDSIRYKKYNAAKFSALFSTPLRDNSEADLKLTTDFISFLFTFDDVVDNYKLPKEEKEKAQLKKELKEIFAVFHKIMCGEEKDLTKIPEHQFPLYKNFCHALLDIRIRMEKLDKQTHQAFLDKFEEYLYSIEVEKKPLKFTLGMTVNEYLEMRRNTGAVWLTMEFIAMVKEIQLSSAIRKNFEVNLIIKAGVEALSILNDLVSQQKELNEPDHHNMIKVKLHELLNPKMGLFQDNNQTLEKSLFEEIKQEQRLHLQSGLLFSAKREPHLNLLQKAINETINYHNQAMFTLINYKNQLDPGIFDQFKDFYNMIVDCNFDNYYWSVFETKRYQVPGITFKTNCQPVTLESDSGIINRVISPFRMTSAL